MRKLYVALFFAMTTSFAFGAEPIVTESTTNSTITSNGKTETTLKSPPPSAISPQFSSGSNSDLCTVGVAGAVQTQILGISAGTTFTEENCVRLKNAKTLYDMGMKVAAVSVMCQDQKVFDAMMNAGTPCPYKGQIGEAARIGWESHVEETRKELAESDKPDVKETVTMGGLGILGWILYSDSIAPYYGVTPNAAASGNTWSMDDVLPSGIPGVDIDLVIYNYTPIKETQDDMVVHIQNENADGTGYIFRESDDWSGVAGGIEIRKVVPATPVNRSQWGDGSIEVEGTGTVENANVIYNYRVDPCYDPQFDPNCPGYEPYIPEIELVDIDSLYDPLNDATLDDALSSTDTDQYDDEESESDEERKKKEEEEEKDSKERLEKALAAAQNAVMFSEAFAQAQLLDAMNMAINMNTYYAASIDGGTYKESVTLVDKDIPDNKQELRNGFAQQLLHEKMIEMQYGK